jgi:phage tail sheath protein FI
MATYKTPDVYVEEISIFPPSVAEVETAVPCFIGYTEKAKRISDDDLHLKAQKVQSLVEYETFFGGGPKMDSITVTLESTSNKVKEVSLSTNYYMYDSLRLFFDNGGGKCYIISIGKYDDASIKGDHFNSGLAVLKKLDEPTMILVPDATSLSNSGLYMVQQKCLKQCADLGDRVAILDLKKNEGLSFDHTAAVEEFRNKIGINYLKYGAAYTPWLKSALPKEISYGDINLERNGGGSIQWSTLTSDRDVLQLLSNLDLVNSLKDDVTSKIIADVTGGATKTLETFFQETLDAQAAGLADPRSITALRGTLKDIYKVINNIAKELIDYRDNETSPVTTEENKQVQEFSLRTDIDDIIDIFDLKEAFQKFLYHSLALSEYPSGPTANELMEDTVVADEWKLDAAIFPTTQAYKDIRKIYEDIGADATLASAKEKNIAYGKASKKAAVEAFDVFNQAIRGIFTAIKEYGKKYDELLAESFDTYKTILKEIKEELTEIPPSGAIAGIFSMVDRTRGVHKAPANVSLSSVLGLTHDIDYYEQEGLNVDVNAGKSINAIRPFTGKGVLVWGARTLAGNDNEWRYISVRRFFNMVEESVKKSTYWAVFEPNDANLWVRLKGMIENYLFQKWRDGALAGATPEQAYFVKVGLGLTMTPQDILEGRLNVEIGMAVVRPAEFIILKFSHKMQES